jgi:heat shock protein HslJ
VAFRVDGDRRILLDGAGKTLVEWTPAAAGAGEPPAADDDLRAKLGGTPTLPAGLTAAGPDRLVGRWVPGSGLSDLARVAHIELAADGSWEGSDGCNANGGRWVANDSGAVLAVAGVQTEIGCDNSSIMAWFTEARAAGLDGETLVLLGPGGEELARLRHEK